MAKTKISEWSTTPASNTDIDGINIAEGCAPSGINDAIRDLMAQVRSWQSGASGDPFNGPMNGTIGATTAYSGAFTTLSASGTTTLSGLTASTALALDASKNVVSVANTGSGSNVLATSPTLVTPALGTPSSATLTNATGLPISTGVSGLGTGVATALGVAVGSAGAPVVNGGALGTPTSATLTNATGLPLSTGVTGTLPIANGGTGLTTTPANGALDIGNGTGFTRTTLTAGSGITITNGAGSISIATSGGSGDVVGPSSATNNGIALFDGTTGKLIKNSATSDGLIYGITVGRGAGAVSTNTALGSGALSNASTTGGFNTALGRNTLQTLTSGEENIAIGNSVLNLATTGSNNVGVGNATLAATTTGGSNVAVGLGGLQRNTTGANSTAIGFQALTYNTTASGNTAVGYQAGYTNATGGYMTAVGYQAAYSSTGNFTTAVGYQALYTTTGTENTAVGYFALKANTTGADSTAVGMQALQSNTSGGNNSALGYLALGANTTGAFNVALGVQSLQANTTASNNTAVGYQAGYSNTTGTNNLFLGFGAGQNTTTGSNNTFVGARGSGTGGGAGNEVTTGSKNTILGQYSGNQGGLDIRTSNNYIVLSDGDGNPRGIFDNSGNFLVGTTSNTIGTDNALVAFKRSSAGYSLICGSAQTGSISYMIKFTYDNTTGTGLISTTNTTVSYATSSDYRLKNSIAPMTGALAKVAQLKPVTYKWNVDGSDGEGFLAHELAEVCPDAVTGEKDAVDADGNPQYQAIDTSFLIATLTAAIQELKAEFDAYKASHP